MTPDPDQCPQCGQRFVIGDWPFCPHGPARPTVHADDIPGGMVVENGFAKPIKVYSHSEHRRLLAAQGLEIRAKWAGEHDKIMSRWDTVDLDAAKTLLERGPQARREKAQRWAQASIPIAVQDGALFTERS